MLHILIYISMGVLFFQSRRAKIFLLFLPTPHGKPALLSKITIPVFGVHSFLVDGAVYKIYERLWTRSAAQKSFLKTLFNCLNQLQLKHINLYLFFCHFMTNLVFFCKLHCFCKTESHTMKHQYALFLWKLFFGGFWHLWTQKNCYLNEKISVVLLS